jgi:hypothetical protein
MKIDEAPARDVADALARFEPKQPASQWELAVLARRIVASAGPFLDARRRGFTAWWQYPAVWARTLIPLGITTALVAAACILWATLAPLPLPSEHLAMRDAFLGSTTSDVISQSLLDALVGPVERAAAPQRVPR